MEPYSGVAVKALVNIQINVEYKSDILFPGQSYSVYNMIDYKVDASYVALQRSQSHRGIDRR